MEAQRRPAVRRGHRLDTHDRVAGFRSDRHAELAEGRSEIRWDCCLSIRLHEARHRDCFRGDGRRSSRLLRRLQAAAARPTPRLDRDPLAPATRGTKIGTELRVRPGLKDRRRDPGDGDADEADADERPPPRHGAPSSAASRPVEEEDEQQTADHHEDDGDSEDDLKNGHLPPARSPLWQRAVPRSNPSSTQIARASHNRNAHASKRQLVSTSLLP